MDAVVIIVIALLLMILSDNTPETEAEKIEATFDYEVLERETAINTTFYHDDNAFRRMTHELGFD